MKLAEHLPRWTSICRDWLADGSRFADGQPRHLDDVLTGRDAWEIAHRSGIVREVYGLGVNDSHIVTALRRIFPNAVFQGDRV